MEDNDERSRMVDLQLARRGIDDARVLEAFRQVPRQHFVPSDLAEFAYRDAPLPIGNDQTISQPYIVAVTLAALSLRGPERVLEIGTGSGYAAAILSLLAKEVFTVERVASLADTARERLARLGYANVHVLHGDGTLGWSKHAPYDAIAVAAGGPEVPKALLEQLKPQGRLVMPVGPEDKQILTRVVRESDRSYRREPIADVRFVPLIGVQGWPESERLLKTPSKRPSISPIAQLVTETAEPITEIETASLGSLLERTEHARLVLLGESTHGTSEFYRMRTRITQALIQTGRFNFVAVEADWPDAARVDNYIIGDPPRSRLAFTPFSRFPTWMWRNEEVGQLVSWLRTHNEEVRAPHDRVGFHGLDLYSLYNSIAAVLEYLDRVDPKAAQVARARYGALTPWQKDPSAYGRAVLAGRYRSCEDAVVEILKDLLERRIEYALEDGERFFDAAQNALVVANAERYYRAMYYGSPASWNLRDTHMFQTLQALLHYYGPDSRGIVWEHNSHVGDALATEMSARGEYNVGQLCRAAYGDKAHIVGFGTDHGTVAAASAWGASMERMVVRPSHRDSYGRIFHDADHPAFLLHLRDPRRSAVRDELAPPRLERAIGVVYRPETELESHYFHATLPRQFDTFIWFDESRAVTPMQIDAPPIPGLPDTFPFGL